MTPATVVPVILLAERRLAEFGEGVLYAGVAAEGP